MSTTRNNLNNAEVLRSKPSQTNKARLKLQLKVTNDTNPAQIASNGNIESPFSLLKENSIKLPIRTDKPKEEDVPFVIHSRPRLDSDIESDDSLDEDGFFKIHSRPRFSNNSRGLKHALKSPNDADSNMHGTIDSVYSKKKELSDSFSRLSFDIEDEDGDDQEPVVQSKGTLKRQRAKWNVLRIVVDDDIEDRDGDEEHPQCPSAATGGDDFDDNEGGWYRRASTLYGAQSVFPTIKQDDGPDASVYGMIQRHSSLYGDKF